MTYNVSRGIQNGFNIQKQQGSFCLPLHLSWMAHPLKVFDETLSGQVQHHLLLPAHEVHAIEFLWPFLMSLLCCNTRWG